MARTILHPIRPKPFTATRTLAITVSVSEIWDRGSYRAFIVQGKRYAHQKMAPMRISMEAISFREDWEGKLFLLRGLWCRGPFLCRSRGHHLINQHSSAQPVGLGASFRAAIFFPHTIGKIGNTLVTASNHIIRKCHVHHHRSKLDEVLCHKMVQCTIDQSAMLRSNI